ncbi:hypothetical protein E1757_25365 [Paenibacillus piri]|uniref:Uncharacterized protein n=2 Tax=Paenibacillus piri TaxID=2547395 RepID=A0A4R5KF41_9BACL|nr:hypothetical protein E1757_25365 [Paenibacillus piri]
MAVFVNPADWGMHKAFVQLFAMVPLMMFLLSLVGRIRGSKRWVSLGLLALIVLQFMTINVFASVWVLAALHPVIALLLFWGSVITVKTRASQV